MRKYNHSMDFMFFPPLKKKSSLVLEEGIRELEES